MSASTFNVGVVIGATIGRGYFNAFEKASDKAKKLEESIQKTNKQLKAVEDLVKYRDKLDELKRKLREAGGSNRRLEEGIVAVRRQYREARRDVRGYGINVNDAADAQRRLARESAALQRRLERLSRAEMYSNRLSDLKTRAIGAAASIASLGATVKSAFDVEQKGLQLGDVIVGENSKARLAKSMQHARAFAKKSLSSETDILEIDYSLRSAGLNDAAAMFGSEIVAKVAEVTQGDVSNVGFIIGDTFKNIGKSMSGTVQEKIQRIGDVLTATKNVYSIKDFGQLGEGLKNSLSAAQANNLSFEQTAALIGQINNGMLKGAEAGTGLKAVLRQLPTAQKSIGFKIVRDKKGNLDMLATLDAIDTAMAGITDVDERAMKLQKAFADEGTAALIPLLNNLKDLHKNYKKVNDGADGTVDKNYQRRLDAVSGKWTTLTQNVVILGAVFGNTLFPILETVFDMMNSIVVVIGELVEKYPVLGEVIGALAIGFGVYYSALIAITAAQLAWNVANAANPLAAGGTGGANFLKNAAAKAGGAVIAGGVGYAVGTWFNGKINKAMIAATAGKNKSFGGWIYDKTHSSPPDQPVAVHDGRPAITTHSSPPDQPALPAHVSARNATNTTAITDNSTTTIHVTQQQGEDGNALATRTAVLLEQARNARQQSSMYDTPEAVF